VGKINGLAGKIIFDFWTGALVHFSALVPVYPVELRGYLLQASQLAKAGPHFVSLLRRSLHSWLSTAIGGIFHLFLFFSFFGNPSKIN
jgi:hypothetical protein